MINLTREEAQPEPMIDGWPLYSGLPQLSEDELQYAEAMTTLIKAGYDKEAKTILKDKREWVGLTDEEMTELYVEHKSIVASYLVEEFVKAIVAKLKQKNG